VNISEVNIELGRAPMILIWYYPIRLAEETEIRADAGSTEIKSRLGSRGRLS
jgi:hypothetical protein